MLEASPAVEPKSCWSDAISGTVLHAATATIATTGIRGTDMANRLKYAGLPDTRILPLPAELASGLDAFVDSLPEGAPGYVLLTYTALLGLRQTLADRGAVAHFWEQ